jgi:hypothetical protein
VRFARPWFAQVDDAPSRAVLCEPRSNGKRGTPIEEVRIRARREQTTDAEPSAKARFLLPRSGVPPKAAFATVNIDAVIYAFSVSTE